MPSIRQFALLQALATHRHFGRAATALGVSQPSLTRSLNRIEEMLGGTLFNRADVTPTVLGKIVLRHSGPMLAGFSELKRELSLAKGLGAGELTVAAGFYPADISGYEAVAALSRRHPDLSIDFRVLDWVRAMEAVLAGAADLAVADTRQAESSSDFEVSTLRSEPLRFFCAADHPLAQRAELTLDDIAGYPWAGPSLPLPMGASLPSGHRCCVEDKATGRIRPRILVESFLAAKQIVLSGEALSAAVPFQLRKELSAGSLVLLPVSAPMINIHYGLILRRGRAVSPAAKAFMKAVRAIESRVSDRMREHEAA